MALRRVCNRHGWGGGCAALFRDRQSECRKQVPPEQEAGAASIPDAPQVESHPAIPCGSQRHGRSTTSRHPQFATRILKKFLPTAPRITEKIKSIKTRKELARIIPGQTIILDGSHVGIERPTGKKGRKDAYFGKKRSTTNTNFVTNTLGVVISTSCPFVRSTHDMTMTRKNPLDFGKWSESMKDTWTKKPDRIRILADRRYAGLSAVYRGADIEIPEKKKNGKELTE